MKIAILCNTSWNIYNFRLNLIKALQEKGHEVVLLAPKDNYTLKVKSYGIGFKEIDMDVKGQNPFNDLMLIIKYWVVLKKTRPDVLLTYTIKPNIYGNIAARFLDIKVISNVTGLVTIFIKPSISTKLAGFLYQISFTKCSRVFFQNQTDFRFFRKKGFIKDKQAEIVPGSGINLNQFNLKKRSFENKSLKVLFVGRIIRDKGIIEFLEAAKSILKKNRTVKFYVVGQMGYENTTALTKEEFQPYLDQNIVEYFPHSDNMLDIYKEMDIMVLPSYREGMSRALLEAAAMKMPIIATDVPGCREIIKENVNGYLVKPQNTQDLTLKLEKMLSLTPEVLTRMGNESRELVKNQFSEQVVIQKYLGAIGEIFN